MTRIENHMFYSEQTMVTGGEDKKRGGEGKKEEVG